MYCRDCKWWSALFIKNEPAKNTKGFKEGWCQRHSPSGVNKNKWPEIIENDGPCGEFEERQTLVSSWYETWYHRTDRLYQNKLAECKRQKARIKKLKEEIEGLRNEPIPKKEK